MSEVDQLKKDEGFRGDLYRCTSGKLTIGYGLNLETGMTEEEASAILSIRISNISRALKEKQRWIRHAPPEVLDVLTNMAYQMGLTGLLKFKRTLGCLRKEEYIEASLEMLDSEWYLQSKSRAKRLSVRIYDLQK